MSRTTAVLAVVTIALFQVGKVQAVQCITDTFYSDSKCTSQVRTVVYPSDCTPFGGFFHRSDCVSGAIYENCLTDDCSGCVPNYVFRMGCRMISPGVYALARCNECGTIPTPPGSSRCSVARGPGSTSLECTQNQDCTCSPSEFKVKTDYVNQPCYWCSTSQDISTYTAGAKCTDQSFCNGYGVASGYYPGCSCSCRAGYSGTRCEVCAAGGTYPYCIAVAPSPVTGGGNGGSSVCGPVYCHNGGIASGTYPNCVCTCGTGYTGTRCNQCAPGYGGYELNGFCIKNYSPTSVTRGMVCTDDLCNHFGTAVGVYPNCNCQCRLGYAGTTCNFCAPGYTGYGSPSGCLLSSVVVSPGGSSLCSHVACSNHGYATGYPNCKCVCGVGYTGSDCSQCAPNYGGKDGLCIAGYNPNVHTTSFVCTNAICNNYGRATGKWPHCVCDCFTGYSGSLCNYCSPGYTGFGDPNGCVQAGGSPSGGGCESVDCGPGGYSTGNWPDCRCVCGVGYTGLTCTRCSDGFGGLPVGGACVLNYREDVYTTGYVCTATFCNGFGTASGSWPSCSCKCQDGYSGLTCNLCASGFSQAWPRCTGGAVGFNTCSDQYCYNGGIGTGVYPNCKCQCGQGYTGDRCDQCIDGYWGNVYGASAYCLTGSQSVYAPGTPCRDLNVCSGHGTASGLWPYCLCTCLYGYGGSTCQMCQGGFKGYPNCIDAGVSPPGPKQCDDTHCHRHGEVILPGCTCNCNRGYGGQQCDMCAPGYYGYPSCISSTIPRIPYPRCVSLKETDKSCGARGFYGCPLENVACNVGTRPCCCDADGDCTDGDDAVCCQPEDAQAVSEDQCIMQQGVENGGTVYRFTTGNSWVECCGQCSLDPDCKAWSWNQNTKACSLKNSVSGSFASTDVVSGSVVGRNPVVRTPTPVLTACPMGMWRCMDGQQCILAVGRCNREQNCIDGSDEFNCVYQPLPASVVSVPPNAAGGAHPAFLLLALSILVAYLS